MPGLRELPFLPITATLLRLVKCNIFSLRQGPFDAAHAASKRVLLIILIKEIDFH